MPKAAPLKPPGLQAQAVELCRGVVPGWKVHGGTQPRAQCGARSENQINGAKPPTATSTASVLLNTACPEQSIPQFSPQPSSSPLPNFVPPSPGEFFFWGGGSHPPPPPRSRTCGSIPRAAGPGAGLAAPAWLFNFLFILFFFSPPLLCSPGPAPLLPAPEWLRRGQAAPRSPREKSRV